MHIRLLQPTDYSALESLVHRDPVLNVYVAGKLADAKHSRGNQVRLNVLGAFDGETLISAVYIGANIIPIHVTSELSEAFARAITEHIRGAIPMTGQANQVLGLWQYLRQTWPAPRDLRENQPLLVMTERSSVSPDSEVRYSRAVDLDALFPACVDMFTEEVGISPIAHGVAPYRTRVQDLIAQRRSFIRMNGDDVMFKAEVGVVGFDVAQIQGVWMNPAYRGQGRAANALAGVVNKVLDDIAPAVSLYVNSYNTPALATYKAVGFHQVDTFATLLF